MCVSYSAVMQPRSRADVWATLPHEWPTDLLPEIQAAVAASGRKLVVLDDDPTGTQTVHDIAVLTQWSVERLAGELIQAAPAFYILTNSRSLPPSDAAALSRTIGANLRRAVQLTGVEIAVVSRSDSTLRGHYPSEVDALTEALGAHFDATLIMPFFPEGGRYTIDDVHYVAEDEMLVPAGETEFAQDAVFGYEASNLRQWVAERTAGRIPPAEVASISLTLLRQGGPAAVTQALMALPTGSVCVVNAASDRDLEVFVLGLLAAEAQGRRYMYRTAASFVRVRAGIAPRSLLNAHELGHVDGATLFVVGSYVPKTSAQVAQLLAQPDVAGIELDARALLTQATAAAAIGRSGAQIEGLLRQGTTTVVYTSRALITGDDPVQSLAIGNAISAGLVRLVQDLTVRPGLLVAKGGITSSDVAVEGLGVERATVLGQALPGVPVWRLGPESRFPGLTYVVFPGNVGDVDGLATLATLA